MKTILVVDDEPDILEVVRSVLDLEGFRVFVLQRGDQVLKHVEKAIPDLILMDVMIAGVDGREICRQLKTHPSYASIPVILFSASRLSLSDVMICGANDFLSKPFDLEHLIKRIHVQVMS